MMGVFVQFAPRLTFAVCKASLALAWLGGVKLRPIIIRPIIPIVFMAEICLPRDRGRARMLTDKLRQRNGSVMEAYRSVNMGMLNGWSKLKSHCPKKGSAKIQKMRIW